MSLYKDGFFSKEVPSLTESLPPEHARAKWDLQTHMQYESVFSSAQLFETAWARVKHSHEKDMRECEIIESQTKAP